MVQQDFFLYDEESGEKEVIIPLQSALIKIEVPEGVNISAQGKLAKESQVYNALMGVKSNDLKTYISMTNGLFSIDVNGIYSVKFNSDAVSTIKIKMLG